MLTLVNDDYIETVHISVYIVHHNINITVIEPGLFVRLTRRCYPLVYLSWFLLLPVFENKTKMVHIPMHVCVLFNLEISIA